MSEFNGWMFDLYDDPARGVAVWWITDDGRRLCTGHVFPVRFFAAGDAARLDELAHWLGRLPDPPACRREEQRDLFLPRPLTVLAVEVDSPTAQAQLFKHTERAFPDLTYYDADVATPLRYTARFGAFPLARCRVQLGAENEIEQLEVLDGRWDLQPQPAPLRVLELEPDCNPASRTPRALLAHCGRHTCRFDLRQARATLINLRGLLVQEDPDVILTEYGDTWLLPELLRMAEEQGMALPLSRDPRRKAAHKKELTYFSYGQIVYRGQQTLLFGRWHLDRRNAMLWDDYALEGALETARITCLPVQTAARTSPGTGISSMQIVTALQNGILVPWHKQQAERPKTALDLLHRDLGGLVYQPRVGVHGPVGAVDFISMYPSVMVKANISPEVPLPNGLEPASEQPGLIPQTLAPLLEKRVALKRKIAVLPKWHPQRKRFEALASAHKWLLVTCFGYLGYKNARFGRIESHEAVTAGGREAILRAKEAAEDLGFEVLHIFVDGLWVQKPGCSAPADFTPILDEILQRTGLPAALDGVYRWVVFLPSCQDARVPVGNRYFGVFQDGSLKVRGIEARRRDTPPWIGAVQMEIVQHLAGAQSPAELPDFLPGALAIVRRALAALSAGRVPLADLLLAQRLTREVKDYTAPSPAARAAAQLEALGKHIRPGQRVRFLWARGLPGVHAWDLPIPPDPEKVDRVRYRTMLLRAASTVLQPLGMQRETLYQCCCGVVEQNLWQMSKRLKPQLQMSYFIK